MPIQAKITPDEDAAWQALRAKLGGSVSPLSEALTVRYAMRLACQEAGIPWPEGAS